jgi:hypothetical protein
VAHEFACKANESDRAALRTVFDRSLCLGTANDKDAILAIKQQIYDVLLPGCGNGYASRMLMMILHRNRQLRAYSLSAPGRLKHTIEEVRAIVEAIVLKARQPRAGCMCKKQPKLRYRFYGLRKQSKRSSPKMEKAGQRPPSLLFLARAPRWMCDWILASARRSSTPKSGLSAAFRPA